MKHYHNYLTELKELVNDLNAEYCVKTRNELVLQGAYGGWQVQITGKRDLRYKDKLRWRKNSLGSGRAEITYGYLSAHGTLNELRAIASSGVLKQRIMRWEV